LRVNPSLLALIPAGFPCTNPAMRRAAIVLILLLPAFPGCAICGTILELLFPPHDSEHARQNAIFEGYQNDRKWMEGKESGAWNPSTLP